MVLGTEICIGVPGDETREVTRTVSTRLCTVKLIYVLVALVEDRVGTTMCCHTLPLACVESSAAGLGSWSGIVSSE